MGADLRDVVRAARIRLAQRVVQGTRRRHLQCYCDRGGPDFIRREQGGATLEPGQAAVGKQAGKLLGVCLVVAVQTRRNSRTWS